jgi:anti-sigma factor RsiW
MLCQEIESRILDYQEGRLPPAQRARVETHLAGCAACREFARQLQQLDAVLAARAKVPVLSDGFERRLRRRVQSAPAVLNAAEWAERKRLLQAEFEAGLAGIGRGAFALDSLLQPLIWPALAAAAGWLAWRVTYQLASHTAGQSPGGLSLRLTPWLVVSAIFLVAGLAEAFPRSWRAIRFW